MELKLIAKTLFLIVGMGMDNRRTMDQLRPSLWQGRTSPAAVMYFGFLAVGLLAGTIRSAGGIQSGGGGGSGWSKSGG